MRAILGRDTLYYGEFAKMRMAEVIVNSYRARKKSKNWAEWAAENVDANSILIMAERLSNGE